MMRLFVALDLREDLKQRLASLMAGLPGATWVEPANLHLTLRYFGEVDEHDAANLDQALSQIRRAPFELFLAGCGIFAQRRGPEAVWIGALATPALTDLQAAVERAAVRAGFAPDEKRFRPHVTLARLRDAPAQRLQAFVAGHNLFKETLPVSAFDLISSSGGPQPIYRCEASYPLNDS